MNKRARNRLIGVTTIIVIAILAIIYGTQMSGAGGSFARKPSELAANSEMVGQNVQVTGPVVAGTWNKQTNPMKFEISDEGGTPGGATIKIVYNGGVPTTFGDGTVAIVTGTLQKGGVVAARTLLTKCPSKYTDKKNVPTVAEVTSNKALVGKPSEVTGLVRVGSVKAAGAPVRFELVDSAKSASALKVRFDQGLPEGFKDGAKVVVIGTLGTDGLYTGVSVMVSNTTAAQ